MKNVISRGNPTRRSVIGRLPGSRHCKWHPWTNGCRVVLHQGHTKSSTCSGTPHKIIKVKHCWESQFPAPKVHALQEYSCLLRYTSSIVRLHISINNIKYKRQIITQSFLYGRQMVQCKTNWADTIINLSKHRYQPHKHHVARFPFLWF